MLIHRDGDPSISPSAMAIEIYPSRHERKDEGKMDGSRILLSIEFPWQLPPG